MCGDLSEMSLLSRKVGGRFGHSMLGREDLVTGRDFQMVFVFWGGGGRSWGGSWRREIFGVLGPIISCEWEGCFGVFWARKIIIKCAIMHSVFFDVA